MDSVDSVLWFGVYLLVVGWATALVLVGVEIIRKRRRHE
jgi:hypothetical protein